MSVFSHECLGVIVLYSMFTLSLISRCSMQSVVMNPRYFRSPFLLFPPFTLFL